MSDSYLAVQRLEGGWYGIVNVLQVHPRVIEILGNRIASEREAFDELCRMWNAGTPDVLTGDDFELIDHVSEVLRTPAEVTDGSHRRAREELASAVPALLDIIARLEDA